MNSGKKFFLLPYLWCGIYGLWAAKNIYGMGSSGAQTLCYGLWDDYGKNDYGAALYSTPTADTWPGQKILTVGQSLTRKLHFSSYRATYKDRLLVIPQWKNQSSYKTLYRLSRSF